MMLFDKYHYEWLNRYKMIQRMVWWREIDPGEFWVQNTVKMLEPMCDNIERFMDYWKQER